MKLLRIYIHRESGSAPTSYRRDGFTLIETIITIGILAVIGSIGLFLSLDQYRSYTLSSERNTIVAMLQKARNQAMNNISETPHGLSIQSSSYVLFHGSSYSSRDEAYDEIIPISDIVTAEGEEEIVFNQLRGYVTDGDGDIVISNGIKEYTISINNEGRINW